MNLQNFEVKRSKVKGYSETTYGQIITYGDIFSHLSGIRERILMKLNTIIHYKVYMTLMTF